MISRRYSDIANETMDYIDMVSMSIVNTTFMNMDDDYTLSNDRAFQIAENEACTIENYKDFQSAVKNGAKYKTWISERDNKVRKTHKNVDDGKTIPINDYFHVGNSLMLYPHDAVNGTPNEIINCRCHVEYFLKNYGTYNKTETNTSKLGSISGLGAGSDPKPLGNDLPKDKIVNPNYNPSDDQWNQNCPSAVIAYEMKIRGETNAEALSAKEYPVIEDMESFSELWENATPKKLFLDEINNLENGRYAVSIDDTTQRGHVMIIEVGDNIKAIDCLTNKIYNNVSRYLKFLTRDKKYNSYKYFRIDDKQLSERGKTFYKK